MINFDRVERALLIKALEMYRETLVIEDRIIINKVLRKVRRTLRNG